VLIIASLSLRLKDLLGPVTKVKKRVLINAHSAPIRWRAETYNVEKTA
jgi:hypothetical protein